jgi:hypothetical protein
VPVARTPKFHLQYNLTFLVQILFKNIANFVRVRVSLVSQKKNANFVALQDIKRHQG